MIQGDGIIAMLMFFFCVPTFMALMFTEGDNDIQYPCMYRLATWVGRIGGAAMAITFLVGVTIFGMWC